ncbi:DNA cytosine methyltransferase [Moraxella catarrhalis]|uniref:DNA cytosine methyltransferase n=1 Tax=Moraxella catarrhalis TaxID=480 RepID=UPI0007F38BE3|nr:DNA (cytosine-5-)-methyltransferase [Moraxella catarrhalis]OAV09527.1 DNA-cytosine methyltransferase [Moraxella catarrhalis]
MSAQTHQRIQSAPNPKQYPKSKPSVGSLFAGIGGFDLGFEWAGFHTSWQVEIDPICRAVLSDRFPHAMQFDDVQTCLPKLQALPNGGSVDVIIGGFPCQDVSMAGKRTGLHGKRTGLFFDAMDIVRVIKPKFVVLENVTGLINSNDGKDLQTVLKRLPNAGMWDFGECLTAVISESPKNAVEYSWSQVLENTHQLSLWLTWGQWNAFLARLNRNRAGRTHTIRYWQGSAHPPSTSIVPISSLYQTDGVRWLSGSERLSMMGFAKDWMRPTLLRLGLREMPLSPQVAQFIASHLMTAFYS